MTPTIMDLPIALVTDILMRPAPSSFLVSRLLCKSFCSIAPPLSSICVDLEVARDGKIVHLQLPSGSYPNATWVRLRTCMQQLDQSTSTRDQLAMTMSGVLGKFEKLHAIELRGPLPALLLTLKLAGSIRKIQQQVREVTLVGVNWKWTWVDTDSGTDTDVTHGDLLSSALGALSNLQSLRFQGVSINTMRFCHLTSIAGGSMSDLDRQGEYDWKNGPLSRLKSLQLAIDICGPSDPHVCMLLSHMTLLTRLKLFSTIHPDILLSMTALQRLHVSVLPNTDMVLASLRHLEVNRLGDSQSLRLMQMTPHLECLEFRNCARVGDLLANLPHTLVSISPLTSLVKHQHQLYYLSGITRLSMCLSCGHTPAMLIHMPHLHSFSLAATDFRTADNLNSLCGFVTELQTCRLVQLRLACFNLTDGSVDLSGLTSLTRLELVGCSWTSDALKQAVTSLPSLVILSLRHCSGLSKREVHDVEHSCGSHMFRVQFVDRAPFLPRYRFA